MSRLQRERLFNILNAILRHYQPNCSRDIIFCPVCHDSLHRSELQRADPKVTLAHIIPQAAGGTQCTLECKGCNSLSGHSFEAHQSKERDYHQFLRGNLNHDVRVIIDGAHVNGVAVVDSGHMHIQADSDRSNPLGVEAIVRASQNDGSIDGRVTIQKFNPAMSLMATLHTAYLYLFSVFGYEYVATFGARLV